MFLTEIKFKNINKILINKLIPTGNEPIYCNSVTNVNDEVFHNPIKHKNDKESRK